MEKDLSESDRNQYIDFLRYNAETLWNKGTNTTNNTFGTFWATKPGEKASLNAGLSGVALIEAAARLKNEGYFDE